MKSYETYKNIDLPWLDAIPAHWNLIGLNLLFADNKVKNEGMIENNILSLSYGNIVKRKGEENFGLIPASYETYQVINPGYIVLRLTDMQNDHTSLRVGLVKEKGIITSAYTGLIPKQNVNSTYFYYLLHTLDLVKYIYVLGGGVRQSSDYNEIKKLKLPFPPVEEQTTIANYLDAQKEKINLFIIQKQKLISMLKLQRQAFINKAVTKGIDEKVKLKSSGVDWLGDIPVHWELRKLKFVAKVIFSNVDKHSLENEIDVELCNYVDVYKNDYIDSSISFMKATALQSEIDKFKLEIGDVLVTKDSETPEDIAVPALVTEIKENLICGYHLAQLKPSEKIVPEYLFRLFQSDEVNAHFATSANGVTRYGAGVGAFKNVFLPIPPIEEQGNIIKHIKTEVKKISEAIIRTEKEIELIKEYKDAMIAEAVLGKRNYNKQQKYN